MPSFSETVSFTTDAAMFFSITLGSSAPSVDLTSATLTGPVSANNPTGTISLGGLTGNGVIEQTNLQPILLSAGNFVFNFMGTKTAGAGSASGTITVTNANAIPEPGTWALMLLGFGATGFAMRRNRRRTFTPQIA
jgi:hypothetical protein